MISPRFIVTAQFIGMLHAPSDPTHPLSLPPPSLGGLPSLSRWCQPLSRACPPAQLRYPAGDERQLPPTAAPHPSRWNGGLLSSPLAQARGRGGAYDAYTLVPCTAGSLKLRPSLPRFHLAAVEKTPPLNNAR